MPAMTNARARYPRSLSPSPFAGTSARCGLLTTGPSSPRGCSVLLLRVEHRDLERAQELHLRLQEDAELLPCLAAGFGDERDRVRRARLPCVLDEVGVLRRDLRAPDREAAQAARFEQPPRGQVVVRVLEHTPERPLVRRLGGLAL